MIRILPFIAAVVLMTIASDAHAGAFALASPTLAEGQTVPEAHVYNGYGHHGKNLSPELSWTGVPAGTRSFAVTMFDPDAPRRGGWWHWLVIDIPANVTHLPEGAKPGRGLPPDAIQIVNDFGVGDYGGPAPPPGKPHRYIFTVYALKVAKLGLGAGASIAEASAAIEKNSLGHASITGLYGR
jgi:Raf kinase inhibitor-like YbhB/YbcL family protein